MIKTKRIWAVLLAVCMFLTLISVTVFADGTTEKKTGSCGKNLTWEYDPSIKTLTISGTGNMANYYSSSIAGSRAPWVNSKIKDEIETVVISDGVTSIGENAFFECTSLKNVTIPSSVRTINEGAFYYCEALTGIKIPESVTSIGDSAFSYCKGLTGVTIPGSVVSIGDSAFDSCYSLTDITILNGVKSIGNYAFSWCNSLINISIPDSVVSIGDEILYGATYYRDESNWENNVLYIGNHLIKANSISGEYAVKPGTKSIADCAFCCSELTGIILPESMAGIGNRAFDNCSGLTSMEIPENVIRIGDYAFKACPDLTYINVVEDNPAFCSENGVLYNKEKTELVRFPQGKPDTRFSIPNGVTSIANGAFADCWQLTGVIMNGVTSIGKDAFNTCSALTSITIPDGVSIISNRAFYNCESLKNVTIPNSVLIIDEEAFDKCSIRKVNYIGSDADWNEVEIGTGNNALTKVSIKLLSGISAKCFADGKIVVKPINIAAGKTVILALYDGEKLVGIQQETYKGTEITLISIQNYTRAKVMVWESFEGMSPVCDFKIIR